MYYQTSDSIKLLSIFDIIKRTYSNAVDSLSVMQDLATEVGNQELQKKLVELKPLFVQCKDFLEEKKEDLRKQKAFLFSCKAEEHEALIEEIIKTTE